MPLIVAWTPFFRGTIKKILQSKLGKCEYECEFVNREEYKAISRDADAYVMHGRDIIVTDLPNQTSPHLNVLFLLEPPTLSGPQIYQVPRNYFNATITYRTDSRYFYPYGYFVPLSVKDSSTMFEEGLTKIVERKKRGSLIFVSRCISPSKREKLIRELGQHTEITVRGKCEKVLVTNKSLPSLPACSGCTDDELIATHRFYVSFENSLCNEYITEKFYKRASQWLVPVVMKRRFYIGTSIPNDSYIALDDFKNVQQLGDYLNFLRNNDNAYKKYFHWRRLYRDPRSYRSDALCKLCEDIYNGTKLVIKNIKDFYERKQCL